MNNFTDSPDSALLHVLEFSDQYTPETLEAAINELERRNLTPEQTANARRAARAQEASKQSKTKKQQEQFNKPGKKIKLFWDKIAPWQEETSTALFKYKLILLLWLILAANGVFGFISTLTFYDLANLASWDYIYILSALINMGLPLIGVFYFYKDQRMGWMLLAALSYLSFIQVFMGMIYQMFPDALGPDVSLGGGGLAISVLYLVYHGVIIYLLLDKSIRAMFEIAGKHIISSVLLTLVVLVLSSISLFAVLFN